MYDCPNVYNKGEKKNNQFNFSKIRKEIILTKTLHFGLDWNENW